MLPNTIVGYSTELDLNDFALQGMFLTFIEDYKSERIQLNECVTEGVIQDLVSRDDDFHVEEKLGPYGFTRPGVDVVIPAQEFHLDGRNLASDYFELLLAESNRRR